MGKIIEKKFNTLILVINTLKHRVSTLLMHILLPAFGFIIFVFANLVIASSSAHAEQLNYKRYGYCSVWDNVDTFTDKLTYTLYCGNNDFYESRIIFSASPTDGQYGVHVGNKFGFIVSDSVTVRIRVDKNQLFKGIWLYESRYEDAATLMKKILFFNDLLNQVASGNKLAIAVSDDYNTETGIIPLVGSSKAIADFKQRIAHLNIIQ